MYDFINCYCPCFVPIVFGTVPSINLYTCINKLNLVKRVFGFYCKIQIIVVCSDSGSSTSSGGFSVVVAFIIPRT